ncbi:MAG: hypothetical protein KGZ92_10735 [Firmicutes bacterium]|nr:hypothetical protein [Dethiobacter sp.]MBS3889743.1 hypothetical protein [Bacillota bacterium]
MMRSKLKESDLSIPIVEYWHKLGYSVRTEVKNCDLVAMRGEELVAVELKLTLGLHALVQATRRQQVADAVYVAVFRPQRGTKSGRWRGVLQLLRRLELGLLLVDPFCSPPQVELALSPQPFTGRRNSKARKAMGIEASQRSLDLNTAGTSGQEIMTAYREHALRLAHLLSMHGPLTAAQLRKFTMNPKTWATLYRNVYGWFKRMGRGIYALTDIGHAALAKYGELVALWSVTPEDGRVPYFGE